MKKSAVRLKMLGLILVKLINVLSIIGVVVFFLATIVNFVSGGSLGSITVDMALSGLIVSLVLLAVTHISFKNLYRRVFVLGILKAEIPGCYYSASGGFDKTTLDSVFALVESGNKYTSEDMLSGEYRGVRFQMSDVTIKNHAREHLYDDKYITKVYTHFDGRMIMLDSPINVPKPVYVYSYEFEHRMPGRYNRYMSSDVNDKVFGDIFDILVQQGGSAKLVLSDKVKAALKDLYQKKNNMGVRFHNQRIYIAINTKENLFDWSIVRGMSFKREIEAIVSQINLLKDFVDLLYGYNENSSLEDGDVTDSGRDILGDNALSDSSLWR